MLTVADNHLRPTANRLLSGPVKARCPHLPTDLSIRTRDVRREYRNATQARRAIEAIERLPDEREAIHLICAGQFSLWDTVPAILSLAAPAIIDQLHLASLSISIGNVQALAELLDAGKVRNAMLLLSTYFEATSRQIADPARQMLVSHGQRYVIVRNHCKIVAAKLADGRTITVESSANLRSKTNLELMVLHGDPDLYRFHTTWMNRLHEETNR